MRKFHIFFLFQVIIIRLSKLQNGEFIYAPLIIHEITALLKCLNKNCIRQHISECATLTRCSRAYRSNLYSSLTYGVNYTRSLILRIFPQHPQTNNHMLHVTRTLSSPHRLDNIHKKSVKYESDTIKFVNNSDFS